jgi:large subunit ribosomal protein L24
MACCTLSASMTRLCSASLRTLSSRCLAVCEISLMTARIRKGDTVIVTTGRDKGKTGEVIEVRPDENRAVVRGVNVARRHQRQTARDQGGIVTKEMPIHISNIALTDSNGKATRVGFRFAEGGRKVRFAKRTGETIDG